MSAYTAPDGTGFDDLKAYQKHIFNNYLNFHDVSGETLVKNPGEICGQEFQMSNLSDCEVQLLDNSDRILASNLSNCKLLLGPSAESVVLRNLSNCEITVACKELRLSDCSDCIVRVFSAAGTTIETCTGIQFGPFNGAYSGLTAQFAAAGLDPAQHKSTVTDFSKRDTSLPEPHFSMLAADAVEPWEVQVPNATGDPENPTLPGAPNTGAEPPAPLNPLPPLRPESNAEGAVNSTPAAEQSADASTEQPEDNAFTEQPADAFTEQPADAFAEQPADDAFTEQPADAFTEQTADDAFTEQPADAFAEQPADDAFTEQTADDAFTEQPADASAEQPADDAFTEQPADAFAEQPADDAFTEQSTEVFAEPDTQVSDPFEPHTTSTHPEDDPFGDSVSGAEDAFDSTTNEFEQPEMSNDDVFAEQAPASEEPFPPEQPVLSDDEEEEESAAYKAFLKQFEERVQQRDLEHKKKREEMKDAAEEELEEHYSTRTNNNAIRAAANRENENDFLESVKKNNEKSSENPWEKVLSLVDLTVDPNESADKSRMRGLLLQLKSAQGKMLES